MSGRNTTSMVVAIIAGVLLLIAGLSGAAAWESIKTFVSNNVADNSAIQMVFAILIFIASFGGLVIILGGLLIWKNKVGVGKFLIALGAGFGLIGLIISIVVAVIEIDYLIGGFLTIGGIGLLLSIVARAAAKNDEEPGTSSKMSKKK